MKKTLILILFIAAIACKEKTMTYSPTKTLKVFSKEARYEDMFEKTETIFLKTDNNCLISKVSQLDVFGNKIFILDQNTKNIFVFDTDGHFLNKIGSRGKGPGEYIRPLSFIISKNDSLFKVFDSAAKKIIVYDFYGDFIREIFIDKYLSSFGEWTDGSGYWGYCAGDLNEDSKDMKKESIKFITFDRDGQEIQNYKGEKVIDNLNIKDCYITNQYKDSIYFVEPYGDKIYSFDGKKITSEYKIDFSGNFIPANLLSKLRIMNARESFSAKQLNNITNKYVFSFLRFFENTNWIYLFTPYQGTSTLYNKKNKKGLTFHYNLFMKNSYETFFWPIMLSGDKLYSAPNPSEIFELLKRSKEKEYSPERIYSLQNFLKNVNEDDNPIIFIYDIKN